MLPRHLARLSFAIFVATFTVAPAHAQSKQQAPPLAIESLTGRDSFDLYCASCHGTTGAGNGPVATALRTRPADLTSLARRNGGTFPRERVAAFIEGAGRPVPAHGSGDMPVWGTIFRGLEPSDARTRVRLANLVAYVESLQVSPIAAGAASPMSGPELFRRYCASCHGASGRGDGPLAGELRRTPPDLTKFSARNGGVFPSERLRRIIDGREVAAHGDRSMPVWGDVFRRQKDADEQTVATRLDALVAFLQALQERPAE